MHLNVQQVRDAVLALVRKRGTRGRQLATFADALGTGLNTQPAVLKVLTSDAQHTERLMAVLDACAAAGDTFSNGKMHFAGRNSAAQAQGVLRCLLGAAGAATA